MAANLAKHWKVVKITQRGCPNTPANDAPQVHMCARTFERTGMTWGPRVSTNTTGRLLRKPMPSSNAQQWRLAGLVRSTWAVEYAIVGSK